MYIYSICVYSIGMNRYAVDIVRRNFSQLYILCQCLGTISYVLLGKEENLFCWLRRIFGFTAE